jgi:hypothetical protein
MHKNATKYNKTQDKWCINRHGASKIIDTFETYQEFSRIFTVQHRNLFWDNNFPKSYLPPIRGSSWHKNEIKIIRRGHYSSNNFQDSKKKKY